MWEEGESTCVSTGATSTRVCVFDACSVLRSAGSGVQMCLWVHTFFGDGVLSEVASLPSVQRARRLPKWDTGVSGRGIPERSLSSPCWENKLHSGLRSL